MRGMIRFAIFATLTCGGCTVNAQSETPAYLLIVQESVRPGSVAAYNENELKLATACATLNCPHPYLALTTLGDPTQVWWLNAFVSAEQREGLSDAYARNKPLMKALKPLGKRKEAFRESVTTSAAKYIPALRDDIVFQITTARFLVVDTGAQQESSGALFETVDGERFSFGAAATLEAARQVAARFGAAAKILSIQPQWSFPDEAWIDADPEFWSSSPAAQKRRGEKL